MRVLFWTETFPPDVSGVGVWASALLPALARRGHEIAVVTSHAAHSAPDRLLVSGIPVHRFHFQRALLLHRLGEMKAVAAAVAALRREFGPHLVHLNSAEQSLVFHHLTREAAPCPTMATVHLFLDAVHTPEGAFARALAAADAVTAVSRAMLGKALALVPAAAPRARVIHNALEAPAFAGTPPPLGPPRLLCVGRLAPEKGFDVALDAFATLRRRFPTADLTIAGDGPERPALEERAQSLGLSDAVRFTGWVPPDSVPRLIEDSTVVVVPSRWDAFGLVALQAAQMGRPVVAARVGGLPEVVVDGETGLLFEREDAVGLAHAIERLLADPDYAAHLGAAARQRALREFDFERMVDAYDGLYRRLGRG